MTFEHNDVAWRVGFLLQMQLGLDHWAVRVNLARVRANEQSVFVPDVLVVPKHLLPTVSPTPGGLEQYDAPLPLVVEVWSPSTGDYDVETKFPVYRAHGHAEIWRIHPYERVITIWRRQPDGSYIQSRQVDGYLEPASLPGVRIPFADLFQ